MTIPPDLIPVITDDVGALQVQRNRYQAAYEAVAAAADLPENASYHDALTEQAERLAALRDEMDAAIPVAIANAIARQAIAESGGQ